MLQFFSFFRQGYFLRIIFLIFLLILLFITLGFSGCYDDDDESNYRCDVFFFRGQDMQLDTVYYAVFSSVEKEKYSGNNYIFTDANVYCNDIKMEYYDWDYYVYDLIGPCNDASSFILSYGTPEDFSFNFGDTCHFDITIPDFGKLGFSRIIEDGSISGFPDQDTLFVGQELKIYTALDMLTYLKIEKNNPYSSDFANQIENDTLYYIIPSEFEFHNVDFYLYVACMESICQEAMTVTVYYYNKYFRSFYIASQEE